MINDIRHALLKKLEEKQSNTSSRLSRVKKIIIGDPYVFAESELPAIAIVGNGGQITARGTWYDRNVLDMTLVIVQPIKETLGVNNHDRVEWEYLLTDLVEWDVEDYQDSLIGILRGNLSLHIQNIDGTKTKATVGEDIRWQYSPNQRGQSATQEARIDFSFSFTSCR